MLSAFMILLLAVDLNSIKSEPNREHRSDLAIDHASSALDDARELYEADPAKWRAALDEVRDAVNLSYQALEESGKNARNNSHFKRAELKTREFLRRLDGLRNTVSFDDREVVEQVRAKVSEVHDELLQRIMSRKK
jgi:hypothetical protein